MIVQVQRICLAKTNRIFMNQQSLKGLGHLICMLLLRNLIPETS